MGDPIEIDALTQAFKYDRNGGKRLGGEAAKKHCAIGSLKTNIGHLDAASGVAGLIKTIKALEHKQLPPSLHFHKPNPKIRFDSTPFYVNTALKNWPSEGGVRQAGVSSFGMGGTNAHLVLREAPSKTQAEKSRPWELLVLSARTPRALEHMARNLAAHLKQRSDQNFADVCFTLQVGRKRFEYRYVLICRNANEAIAELERFDQKQAIRALPAERDKKIAFLFSGQGSQYMGMAKHLYQVELPFRQRVDSCIKILRERFVYLYEHLQEDDFLSLTELVHQTFITQPLLFTLEYALAETLISWGIKPDVMLGHSVGEYVAACLAGVFTLEQALEIVAIRGKMIQDLPKGEMLSVGLSEQDARQFLGEKISLAAINGPKRCVLAGEDDAIFALQAQLNENNIDSRILLTSHAFHSHMLEPLVSRFSGVISRRPPQPPTQPFISSLTGDWIRPEEAVSPHYWAMQLRKEVQFYRGLGTLFESREHDEQDLIIMELGPGKVLNTLTRQSRKKAKHDLIVETMRRADDDISDTRQLLTTLGQLWLHNVDIDWATLNSGRQRYRVSLPTYPFERSLHWVEPRGGQYRAIAAETILADDVPGYSYSRPDAEGELQPLPGSVEPQGNVTEDQLARLWMQSLGLDQIKVTDDFFDLGGDSLLAVKLVGRMVKAFDVPIATHILLQKSTIAELAEFIDSAKQPSGDGDVLSRSPLVVIQQGNARKKPLFMVHPIGGEVYFYRDLAHQLGADQPLLAFQASSLSGREEPLESVPEMAQQYIQAMRDVGAEPPYLLGGSSFGGLVAYEMAQQFKAAGENVRLLVMIDTPLPSLMPSHLTDSAAILEYLLKDHIEVNVDTLRKLSPQAQIEYIFEDALLSGKSHLLPPHLGVPMFKTWIANQKATFAYQPQGYPGGVIFFRHTEPMPYFPSAPHEAWKELVEGTLEVHQVPGNHVTMNYPPNVKSIATHLKGNFRHVIR